MPRGYRCIVIAAVGWLIAAHGNSHAQTKQDEASSNISAPTKPPPATPVQPLKPVEPSKLERPCNEGGDDRESDLCAQWKAADAARDAADYTFWALILGAVGTIGLFWTLYYTRAAVQAARNATNDAETALAIAQRNAEAALESNEIARKAQLAAAAAAEEQAQLTARSVVASINLVEVAKMTAQRQLRAYISVDSANLKQLCTAGMIPQIHVVIKNTGQTPARDLRIESDTVLRDASFDCSYVSEIPGNYGTQEIGMGVTRRIEAKMETPLSVEDIEALQAGTRRLFFLAYGEYFDVFDTKQTFRLTYCARHPTTSSDVWATHLGNVAT